MKIHYMFDPLCGWCYAAEPLLKHLKKELGGQVSLLLHGGGLMEGPAVFPPDLQANIVKFSQRITALSGVKFGEKYFQNFFSSTPEELDSFPAIRAILAVQESSEMDNAYLSKLLYALHFNGENISRLSVLERLAVSAGIARDLFRNALGGISTDVLNRHVQESRSLLRIIGGQGYPTLAIEHDGRYKKLDHGPYYGRPIDFCDYVKRELDEMSAVNSH